MLEEEGINIQNMDIGEEKKVSFFDMIVRKFSKNAQPNEKETIEKLLELLKPTRYTPAPVQEIVATTRFSTEKVKFLYRNFKQVCPTGISNKETLKEVFKNIYPIGDSTKYAHLVFISIDANDTGEITFGDYMTFLSRMTNGSVEEKIGWIFQFYDVNGDGVISRDEMMKVEEN